MSRLKLVAQMLRSDNANERHVAVTKIESMTGRGIQEIIIQGATRITQGDASGWILDHARMKHGDALIVAVSAELVGLQMDWSDLIEAGSTKVRTSSAEFAGFQDIFNDMFKNFSMGNPVRQTPQPRTQEQAWAQSNPKQVMRITRDELPVYAVGVPYITRSGIAKNGNAYAVVRFSEILANGVAMKPTFDVIAFGTEWVEELKKAEENSEGVLVVFGQDRTPGKLITIKKAL